MSGRKTYPGPTGENTVPITVFYRMSGQYLERLSADEELLFLTDRNRPVLVLVAESMLVDLGANLTQIDVLRSANQFFREFSRARQRLESGQATVVSILRNGTSRAFMILASDYSRLARVSLSDLGAPRRTLVNMQSFTRRATEICLGLGSRYDEVLLHRYQRPEAIVISAERFAKLAPEYEWPEAHRVLMSRINKGLKMVIRLIDEGPVLLTRFNRPVAVLLRPASLAEVLRRHRRSLTLKLSWTQFAHNASSVFRETERRGRTWAVVTARSDGIIAIAAPLSALGGRIEVRKLETVTASELNQNSSEQLERLGVVKVLIVERLELPVGAVMTLQYFTELFDLTVSEIEAEETTSWEDPNLPTLPAEEPDEDDLRRVLSHAWGFFRGQDGEILPDQVREFWERLRDIYPEIVNDSEAIGGELEDRRLLVQTVGSFFAATLFSLPHETGELESGEKTPEGKLPMIEAEGLILDPTNRAAWYRERSLPISRSQFYLLLALTTDPLRVVPYSELLRSDPNRKGGTILSLRSEISQLRGVLIQSGVPEGELIINYRELGYSLLRPTR